MRAFGSREVSALLLWHPAAPEEAASLNAAATLLTGGIGDHVRVHTAVCTLLFEMVEKKQCVSRLSDGSLRSGRSLSLLFGFILMIEPVTL